MYKVLIVDDKVLIRKGIISSIDWSGLGIELAGEARNGQQALEAVEKTRPDIVITDIRMPDMDGLELLQNLYETASKIVTIVISGYDDFEYAKKAMKYGSIDYIMKPIDPLELNGSLKKACSILIKDKTIGPNNDQLVKDFFQKSIIKIQFNLEEYRGVFEPQNLNKCLFCVTIIKDKTNDGFLKKIIIQPNGVKVCTLEEDKGITALIFYADSREVSINNFEITVNRTIKEAYKSFCYEEGIIGTGQPVVGGNDIFKAYKTACETALYCLLSENESILFYNQVLNRKSYTIRQEEYESELIVNITSGNPNKSAQILEDIFDRVLSFSNISIESIRALFRNLCYILIKLNVDFESEIYEFLDKINQPAYMLKYGSIYDLAQVIYNFYRFAAKKYLEESGGKSSLIIKVKDFIDNNYREDIGLNKLSALFHVNASYLTRIFKEEEGYSINEFIIKRRIENAKKILESGKVNIQKLAENVGYEDSTYFFRVFKKVTGMTPREYLLKNTR